jgi:DNA-binding transcriptional ArsR family regulator
MAENVVFLEPGDERAQKIAKAMGSQTASDILQILGEHPKSLTDITDKLAIPMNTAKYHIENLLDAGLVAIADTKYSVKGREVKLYTLTNQLLIVAPKQSAVRSLFLKYASLFGIVALCSLLVSALSPVFGPGSLLRGSVNSVNSAPQYAALGEDGGTVAKAVAENVAQNVTPTRDVMMVGAKGFCETAAANLAPAPQMSAPVTQLPPETWVSPAITGLDPALAFFLGGVLVIFILVCYEAWLWKRK